MKRMLEKLWNEYFSDECSSIDTEEGRILAKKALELHEKVNYLLNAEQQKAVEKYLDVLCDIESLFAQKAFLKGCEFSVSFIFETGSLQKTAD